MAGFLFKNLMLCVFNFSYKITKYAFISYFIPFLWVMINTPSNLVILYVFQFTNSNRMTWKLYVLLAIVTLVMYAYSRRVKSLIKLL